MSWTFQALSWVVSWKNEENIMLEIEGMLQNCPIDFNVKFSQKLKSGSPLKLDSWKSVEAIEKHVPRELELYMSRGDDRWNAWKRLKNEGVDRSQRRWSFEDSQKGRVFLKKSPEFPQLWKWISLNCIKTTRSCLRNLHSFERPECPEQLKTGLRLIAKKLKKM